VARARSVRLAPTWDSRHDDLTLSSAVPSPQQKDDKSSGRPGHGEVGRHQLRMRWDHYDREQWAARFKVLFEPAVVR
jgi:hypothetical protein